MRVLVLTALTALLLGALVAVLGVTLMGCTPRVAYHPDPAFPDDEVEAIWQAARAWDAIVKPERRIYSGSEWTVVRAEPPGGFGFNGLCRRSVKTIWIRPEPIGASTKEVAAHEWGHALGLGHTKTGVMMPHTVSMEFTPEVIEDCKRVGACR
jgi:hypothetical protein